LARARFGLWSQRDALSRLPRDSLLGDSELLPAMFRRIVEERSRRLALTHMSSGQANLLEPEPKVRARQERIRRKLKID